ncbi:MAG: cofactor assembly of complex C subunit B [Jaaginema sp. PMC 1079.18]|nr:cofactor assembly of complex C subunit B [Jaaginema sp. PMC 1080.18]MEC4851401.1 cofactor assembly of complex C subunit B [Jaaginema sp. PMC 1079.18]MEC4868216.1 cofactor assembly of complex C subunit B [Jaaginema sp. PMC 1078.18]
MNIPVISSTFFLTILLGIGLFFFIRASVKDRTTQEALATEIPQEKLLPQLQDYFDRRAYRVTHLDRETQAITFEGFVRPSWFLAIFLTFLAACGFFCLALVFIYIYPPLRSGWFGLSLLSPLAGWFYWQKAGRVEKVILQVEALGETSVVKVTAHRDELIALRRELPLTLI